MAKADQASAVRALMQSAIANYSGSEKRFGSNIGFSQNAVWAAKRRGRVSPQMARRIDEHTRGAIPASDLCPEVFAPLNAAGSPLAGDRADHRSASSSDPNPETDGLRRADTRAIADTPAARGASAEFASSSEQPSSTDREITRV